MSNLVSIRRRKRGDPITPQTVAMERLHAGELQQSAVWIPLDRLRAIQLDLEKLFDMVEAASCLSDDDQDKIEALGGIDHEAVFDLAFDAHFELSIAEETMRLLKASLASKGLTI